MVSILVSGQELLRTHKPGLEDDVGASVVLAPVAGKDSAFCLETLVEARPRKRREDIEGRILYAGRLEEVQGLLEDRGAIVIEAEDDAHLYGNAVEMDAFDGASVVGNMVEPLWTSFTLAWEMDSSPTKSCLQPLFAANSRNSSSAAT